MAGGDAWESAARRHLAIAPRQPRPAMSQPRLRVTHENASWTTPIAGDRFTLGSDLENDLQVSDRGVSARHAAIMREGDRYLLRDLGSDAGTFVNDQRVAEKRLAHGDRIGLGKQGRFGIEFLVAEDKTDTYLLRELEALGAALKCVRELGSALVLEEVLERVLDAALG